MYAAYCYKAGSNIANILSDLTLLITGTTDINALSTDCVKANTSLVSVVPSGWTLFDNAAGTNQKCIRAVNQDDISYKYVILSLPDSSTIRLVLYESWNATTHTGINPAALSHSLGIWSSGEGGYFYIYATARNLFILPWITAGYQTAPMIMEFSRAVLPSTYPCAVSTINNAVCYTASGSGYLSRVKNFSGTGDVGPNNIYGIVNYVSLGGVGLSYTKKDLNENTVALFYKPGVGVTGATKSYLGDVYDIFITPNGLGNTLDQISYNGKNYTLIKSTYCTILIPME